MTQLVHAKGMKRLSLGFMRVTQT